MSSTGPGRCGTGAGGATAGPAASADPFVAARTASPPATRATSTTATISISRRRGLKAASPADRGAQGQQGTGQRLAQLTALGGPPLDAHAQRREDRGGQHLHPDVALVDAHPPSQRWRDDHQRRLVL